MWRTPATWHTACSTVCCASPGLEIITPLHIGRECALAASECALKRTDHAHLHLTKTFSAERTCNGLQVRKVWRQTMRTGKNVLRSASAHIVGPRMDSKSAHSRDPLWPPRVRTRGGHAVRLPQPITVYIRGWCVGEDLASCSCKGGSRLMVELPPVRGASASW